MEVALPSQFDFNSSPHVSAPSTPTPKVFGHYYTSAPTSPSHLSHFYRDFDDFSSSSTAVHKTGDDFAFDVMTTDDWDTASLPADELFDGGVIKPMNTPAKLKLPAAVASPLSIIHGAFSPRQKSKKEADEPFLSNERGRERGVSVPKSTSRRAARSLSPIRDGHSQCPWEQEEKEQLPRGAKICSESCSVMSKGGQKKWRLRDFFLFRSASEGRAADKDPLKKYTASLRRSSFRAADSPGSGSGSRRRGPVSAHERHYTVNRAASDDLKKKTFLPYKQGILGRLAFNPAVHALANGFGFSRK